VTHTNAGAAIRAGRELLDLAVVQTNRDAEPLLDEQLGECAASGSGGVQDVLGEVAVEHARMLAAGM
jgi:hypothetical protein